MKTKSPLHMLFGLTVVVVGAGFLLDAIGVWDFSKVIDDLWPLLIVIVGVLSLMSNPKIFVWPAFVIGAGVLLLLSELGTVDFNVWNVIWPSALILFGLTFIFEKLSPQAKASDVDEVDLFVAFSGIESKNNSSDFRGGKLTAVFGGIDLDLREAEIKKTATIDVFAAFGGIDMRVPKGWMVKAEGLPLFGGWDNKSEKPTDKNAPVLIVRGTCMFGGFEIKN